MTVAITLLGIAALVFLHELGHFSVALGVGVRPRSFYVGFPPPIVKKVVNGIEYGIGSIPLGGLVRIPGMHRPAAADLEAQLAPAVREAPELRSVVNAVRRDLDAGNLDAARAGAETLRTAIAQAELTALTRKTAERALRDLDEGASRDAYWRQRTWKRVAIILAGPAMNIVVAIALFAAAFMMSSTAYRLGFSLTPSGKVVAVLADHPAQRIGMRRGDEIVAIDGKPVTPDEIPTKIASSKGRPITVTVRRGGSRLVLGPARTLKTTFPGESFGTAVKDSFRQSWAIVKGIVGFFVHLPQRHKELHSTIGIVKASDAAVRQGLQYYVGFLGFLSLSLGIFNLLPLLPLDGGHIVFSLIEGLRGRAVRREVYERASAIGIAVFALLVVVGLSNDTHGFGSR
jgi:regulator of sigma E protease